MLHKVRALETYKKMNVKDQEQGKVLDEGFVFEVDDQRLEILKGKNSYGVAFVEEIKEADSTGDEAVAEKPKRRNKKK